MTETLRDLLHERVADIGDVGVPDLAAGAWRQGRARRRRRVLVPVAAGAVAAVLIGTGVVVAQRDDAGPEPAGPASPTAVPTATATTALDPRPEGRRPDTRVDGVPAYWAPTVDQEATLPLLRQGRPPVPEVIDLAADAPSAQDAHLDHAEAAFAVSDDVRTRIVLVGAGARYRTLDLPAELWHHESPTMLSPTGTYLALPDGDALRVFDVAAGTWSTVRTPGPVPASYTWLGDTSVYLRPHWWGGRGLTYDVSTGQRDGAARFDARDGLDLGPRATPYGRSRNGPWGSAQAWFADRPIPGPDGVLANPEVLLVSEGDSGLLVLSDGATDGRDSRYLQCCPVATWADDDRLVYESHGPAGRILAWQVGTHRFERVADVVGITPGEQTWLGSYARWWD